MQLKPHKNWLNNFMVIHEYTSYSVHQSRGVETWHLLEPNYFNGSAELQGDLVGWAHGEQEREAS